MTLSPTPHAPATSIGLQSHLGIVVTQASREQVDGEMTVGPHHLNGAGVAHGGALMSLADELGARGAVANLPPGAATTTLESKTNFFRAARPGIVRGTAVPLHVGRSTMVWQTTLRDGEEKTLGVVTQTQMVLLGEAAPPPAPVPAAPPPVSATPAAEAKRAEILKAGARIMGARGFANATMKEIAAAAGMHVPTMYQYVRSKDELLLLISDDSFRALTDAIDAATAPLADPVARLRAAIVATVETSETYRAHMRLIARETALLPPPIRARVHVRWHDYLRRYAQIIEDGQAVGLFREIDPKLAAHLVESLCEAWAIRRFLMRQHGLTQFQAEVVDLVLNGIKEREAA